MQLKPDNSPGSVVVVASTGGAAGGVSVLAALLSRASSSTVKDMRAHSGLWRKRCQLHMLQVAQANVVVAIVAVVVVVDTHTRALQSIG